MMYGTTLKLFATFATLTALGIAADSRGADPATQPAPPTIIRIDASQPGRPVSRYLTGACIEDVNHEIYVGSSRVDLQACKLEYSIVSPK